MLNARLNIVVALPSEARPINQLLGLQRQQPDGDLPLYAGDDIALVLTGPGIDAAAAGVEYLHRINREADPWWLNIGIAGHGDLSVGDAILASEVSGPTNRSWRMTPLATPGCLSSPIQTVTQPVDDYPDGAACDMEASGFVEVALKVSPLEKIQLLKFVSDNRDHPSREINARMVGSLIRDQSALIKYFIERILREDD